MKKYLCLLLCLLLPLCAAAEELYLPWDTRIIEDYAFYNCAEFTGRLRIPDGVERIGDHAFDGCAGLSGVTLLPETVKEVGEAAFANCPELRVYRWGQEPDVESLSAYDNATEDPFIASVVVEIETDESEPGELPMRVIVKDTNDHVLDVGTLLRDDLDEGADRFVGVFQQEWYEFRLYIPYDVTAYRVEVEIGGKTTGTDDHLRPEPTFIGLNEAASVQDYGYLYFTAPEAGTYNVHVANETELTWPNTYEVWRETVGVPRSASSTGDVDIPVWLEKGEVAGIGWLDSDNTVTVTRVEQAQPLRITGVTMEAQQDYGGQMLITPILEGGAGKEYDFTYTLTNADGRILCYREGRSLTSVMYHLPLEGGELNLTVTAGNDEEQTSYTHAFTADSITEFREILPLNSHVVHSSNVPNYCFIAPEDGTYTFLVEGSRIYGYCIFVRDGVEVYTPEPTEENNYQGFYGAEFTYTCEMYAGEAMDLYFDTERNTISFLVTP